VAYVVRTEDFDGGIMISASHNPFYDNGIKLLNSRGEKMDEETILKIEEYLDGKIAELPMATKERIGCTIDYSAGRNRYTGYLISLAIRSYRGMRVGLDCANGSSWMLAKNIFDALGAKTYVINNEPDGTNINTNCGSTHIEGLQELVRREKLDVGFAYDGDADRCLAVDENGDVVDGDKILYIYGRYMKERGKLLNNTVVTTVMSNLGLYKAFDEMGIDYEKTAVGDKYVYENMLQNGHRLGGEQSGHIIFSKYASTGDGILTSIKLMEVILERKTTLSKLAEPVHIYPQLLENVRVPDKEAALQNPALKAAIAEVEQELGDDGRVLIRPSGTEPLVRVMVEAANEELCRQYVDRLVAEVQ
jgi:phosphoglucosamine mutase